jgi:hypothetical protein
MQSLTFFLLVGACVVVFSRPVSAAEDSGTDQPTSETSQQEGAAQEAKTDAPAPKTRHAPTARKKTSRDDDVFRPSEEISEDFAVSFPADI